MKRFHARLMRAADGGATAVEFALIAPILLLLVFGIIDYGLWFSDSLSAKQGVREAARQGVVANFGDPSCDLTGATGDANSQALMCTAQDRIGGITGDAAVKVVAPSGWVRGGPLVVCAQIPVEVGTGLVPLPNDRVIRSQVEMAIEKVDPAAAFSGGEESAPTGTDWSWCA
jgi:Flp pilus assembly protein TadG